MVDDVEETLLVVEVEAFVEEVETLEELVLVFVEEVEPFVELVLAFVDDVDEMTTEDTVAVEPL